MGSNGGEVAAYNDVWSLHPILDNSDRKRLSRSCNDILRETRAMRDCEVGDREPGNLKPLMRTAGSGLGGFFSFFASPHARYVTLT